VAYFTSSAAISSSSNLYWDNTNARLGIGTSTPETLLHLSKSTAGGEGAYIFIDNPAGSTLGNKAGIKFANDTGASFSGYSSFIESINTDAGTGAAALTFGTWNGSSRAERVRISAVGNLGIGITTPTYLLDVVSLGSPSARVRNGDLGGTATLLLETANNFSGTCQTYIKCIGTVSNGRSELAFATAGGTGDATATERMRIPYNGGLKIIQAADNFGYEFKIANVATNEWSIINGGDNQLYIGYNSVSKGVFSQITGTYTALSDKNKKKDFELSTIGLNAILGLKPTLFRMIDEDETSNKHLGFIAQEVKEFIPEAYNESTIGDTIFIGLDYQPITATLVKAIQEMNTKIIQLEQIVATK
jgi:hypothetical protein